MKQKYKKMKKTFRLFSMTMFVLLMTVCFSACSSDDDGEPNGSPAKKISRFVDTDDTINFAYNESLRNYFRSGSRLREARRARRPADLLPLSS